MSATGYAYDASYGYYGYGYGSYAYGYDGYASYGDYPHPNAVAYLYGPGSTADVGGPYAHSYAAESARGGTYSVDTSYYGTNLTQVRSYSYQGADYSFSSNDTYIDYRVETPGSPLGDGTRYGPALPYGYGALDAIDLYGSTRTTSSGSTSYSAVDRVTTEQFASGYTISYHSYTASESYGGHLVPGSFASYSYATITDPAGDTSPFAGSTGYYYQSY